MLRLVIGNKNDSSWFMRPWVLLRQAGIPFEERLVRFDSFATDSAFKRALQGPSPTGQVPVPVDEDAPGGPLLFGGFSVADACYAPVCLRLRTYALSVSATVAGYVERVLALPGVQDWVRDALAEQDFLPFEEPYRLHR